ncbi:MAG TPA: hypothetical protein DD723_04575 [Candidatus Omnitrophica bacterium]|nr:hypothetical protein [Candidatus Omnitrophota bacterium]
MDWSKQRLLLSINTDGKRKFLEKKTLNGHWSKRQISEQLKAGTALVKNPSSDSAPVKKLTAIKGRPHPRAGIPSYFFT